MSIIPLLLVIPCFIAFVGIATELSSRALQKRIDEENKRWELFKKSWETKESEPVTENTK